MYPKRGGGRDGINVDVLRPKTGGVRTAPSARLSKYSIC